MDIRCWSIWILILIIIVANSSTSTSVSCIYTGEFGLMDCSNTNVGPLKASGYPLNITSITNLLLINTGLSALEDNVFTNLTRLVELNLAVNYLESVHHPMFSSLNELFFLILGHNRISSLTDGRVFESQRKLIYLSLVNNRLTTLPAEVMYPLVSLKRLYLSLNPFECDCNLYSTMVWCEQKCFITEATCKTPANVTWPSWKYANSKNCKNARPLTSNNMRISNDSHGNISCSYSCLYTRYSERMDCKNIQLTVLKAYAYPINITTLRLLDLQNTGLTTLDPEVFSYLRELEFIRLKDNHLDTLHYLLFANLTELKFIDLSYNRLMSLSDERIFASQGKLETLQLKNNRLIYLAEGVLRPLNSLQRIILSGNPFECDCRLRATMLWCEQRNIDTHATCNKPKNFSGSSWKILYRIESCEAHGKTLDVSLLAVAICVPLICMCCGLVASYYWWRKRKSGSSHGESAGYDDVELKEICNQNREYVSILPDLPDWIRHKITRRVISSTAPELYDDVGNPKYEVSGSGSYVQPDSSLTGEYSEPMSYPPSLYEYVR